MDELKAENWKLQSVITDYETRDGNDFDFAGTYAVADHNWDLSAENDDLKKENADLKTKLFNWRPQDSVKLESLQTIIDDHINQMQRLNPTPEIQAIIKSLQSEMAQLRRG